MRAESQFREPYNLFRKHPLKPISLETTLSIRLCSTRFFPEFFREIEPVKKYYVNYIRTCMHVPGHELNPFHNSSHLILVAIQRGRMRFLD